MGKKNMLSLLIEMLQFALFAQIIDAGRKSPQCL